MFSLNVLIECASTRLIRPSGNDFDKALQESFLILGFVKIVTSHGANHGNCHSATSSVYIDYSL